MVTLLDGSEQELPYHRVLTDTTELDTKLLEGRDCGSFYSGQSQEKYSTDTPRFTALPRYCAFYKLKVCGNPV